MNKDERKRQRLWQHRREWFVVAAPVAIAFIGLVWPKKLEDLHNGELSWQGALFVAATIAFLIVAAFWLSVRRREERRQERVDRRRRRRDANRRRVDRLRQSIHDSVVILAVQEATRDEKINAILQAMADAMHSMADKAGVGGANVMTHVGTTNLTVQFFSANNYRSRPRGYLELRRSYSAMSPREQPYDANIDEFALPLADGKAELPGAPVAFSTPRGVYYPDASELHAICDDAGFDKRAVDAVRTYFRTGAGKDIRSMLSLPIPARHPVAVVNVHHSQAAVVDGTDTEVVGDFVNSFDGMIELLEIALELK